MGCTRGLCVAEKVFIFINIAFAMYSGALLATAARLAWDPSTYTWFRFLCAAQYRVSAAYVLAAGLWLAALVYVAAAATAHAHQHQRASRHPQRLHNTTCLHLYAGGVACLALSEVGYGAWMAVSLERWWRTAPQAELARRGIDLLHDIKPALLAMERYKDVARPLYDMIEEVEREAPNNAFVIIIFGALGAVLQVAAFVMARRLARRATYADETPDKEKEVEVCRTARCDDDSDSGDGSRTRNVDSDPPPGWRKKANLRMYTILDKIF